MLYSMNRDEQLSPADAVKRYHRNIMSAYELYLYNLYFLARIAQFAESDLRRRQSKHLPNDIDKIFTDRLASNPLSQVLIKDDHFQVACRRLQLTARTDNDNVRKLYISFAKTDEYKAYLAAEDIGETHRHILLKLYKHCTTSELFNEIMEDYSANWIDDKSLVVGTVKKTLKALPSDTSFLEKYRPGDDTVKEFGETMLRYVVEKDKELLGVIEPVLKNWDAERVAVMDMILLKMALTELMIFPTIPTKVTLNEFVEIAKLYSTDKSKDFINGILDRLMKKLHAEGKIKKEGRGLLD